MADQHFGKQYRGQPPVNYEQFFVPAIGAPLAEDLVRLASLDPGDRVLDVACGTGVVARLASQRVGADGTVAGLDVNPGMLAVARSAAPPGAPIEWHTASAEKMPFPDASFDVVLCQMGLQFVPDRQGALREMGRVLARDGRLLLSLPGPTPQPFRILREAIARHVGPEAASFVDVVFSLHDSAEIQNLFHGADFRDISIQSDTKSLRLPPPDQFLWQYVSSTPLAGPVAQVDDACRESLWQEVAAGWKQFVEGESLVLQLRNVVATALK